MKKIESILFIIVLGVTILTPSILFLLDIQFGTSCDNNYAGTNQSKLKQQAFYLFENKFDSTFAFKNNLIQQNTLVKINLFNASPHPEKAVIGKGGFYFYTDQADRIFDNFAKRDLLNKQALDSITNHWIKDYDLLKSLNIDFKHAVWPNKSSIYKNLIPWNMQLQQATGKSRTTQIIDELLLKDKSYPIIDTRPILIESQTKKIYHKYDTHWKADGAFIAFKQLLPKSFVANQQYTKRNIAAWKYDLVQLMGFCDSKMFPENEYDYMPINFNPKVSEVKTTNNLYFETYNPQAAEKKHLVYFGDSYSLDTQFRTFLSWQYDRVTFFRTQINMAAIKELKPNIVIIGNVERYF